MNESLNNPLAEALRQWVEICLLQIEEKRRIDFTPLEVGGMEAEETLPKKEGIEVET